VSLRKSPTMTPARLAANRRSALRSTGPRTPRGKARSSLNALTTRVRSESSVRLIKGLMDGTPGTVQEKAARILTPEELSHPVFASFLERFQKTQLLLLKRSPAYRRAQAELRSKIRERRRKAKKNPNEA
jgi:hypothetical protein